MSGGGGRLRNRDALRRQNNRNAVPASGTVDFYTVVVNPILEIVGSLALGALAGWLLTKPEKLFRSNRNRVAITIGFVFLTVALSKLSFPIGTLTQSFSPLLVRMMLGGVFCNLCPQSDEIMNRADKCSSPLMALFFALSGAEYVRVRSQTPAGNSSLSRHPPKIPWRHRSCRSFRSNSL